VLADGALTARSGWQSEFSFRMPPPIGIRTGHLFESADAVTLPPVWPGLRSVEFFVDTNVRGLNTLFRLAATRPKLRRLIEASHSWGLWLSRWLGRAAGGLGYEIEGQNGEVVHVAFTAAKRGYITAVAPAVLVVRRLMQNDGAPTGLIAPDVHVDPQQLVQYLLTAGIRLMHVRQP
jgi:hypothetical protein